MNTAMEKQTHTYREQASHYQWGQGGRRGKMGELSTMNHYVQSKLAIRDIVQHREYKQYFIITLNGV